MNVVLIIPTGIGAEIGGHAGDGNAVAKLIAECCDTLITHPNVVNASDINEMTENTYYVEGSILDRFLRGEIELEEVTHNKILVVTNPPLEPDLVNSVSAARATIGCDAYILELTTPLIMIATMENGIATGEVRGWEELVEQVKKYKFEALGISTPITYDMAAEEHYIRNGGVNPYGGVEAKASRLIASALNCPVAHSPCPNNFPPYQGIVDPRMSAEFVSVSYIHCILKGLNTAPIIGKGMSVDEVDVLISPFGCFGPPHKACLEREIPIIYVRENQTVLNDKMPKEAIIVDNYIEAAGLLMAWDAGILPSTVRRPLQKTTIIGDIEKVTCLDEIYEGIWDERPVRLEAAYQENKKGWGNTKPHPLFLLLPDSRQN